MSARATWQAVRALAPWQLRAARRVPWATLAALVPWAVFGWLQRSQGLDAIAGVPALWLLPTLSLAAHRDAAARGHTRVAVEGWTLLGAPPLAAWLVVWLEGLARQLLALGAGAWLYLTPHLGFGAEAARELWSCWAALGPAALALSGYWSLCSLRWPARGQGFGLLLLLLCGGALRGLGWLLPSAPAARLLGHAPEHGSLPAALAALWLQALAFAALSAWIARRVPRARLTAEQ